MSTHSWETITDELHQAGWSYGYCRAIRDDGHRYVVQGETLEAAFGELKRKVVDEVQSNKIGGG